MSYCFPSMLSCFWLPRFCIEFIPSPRSSNGNLIGLIVGISIGVGGILFVFIVFYIIRERKRLQTNDDEGKPEIKWHLYDSCWTSFNIVYVLKLLNISYFTNFFSELARNQVAWFTLCLSTTILHIQLQFSFMFTKAFIPKHTPICTCAHIIWLF